MRRSTTPSCPVGLPGRAALVLRSGPGLVVELTDDTRFAVTLDDPGTPAALLNTLAGGGARSRA